MSNREVLIEGEELMNKIDLVFDRCRYWLSTREYSTQEIEYCFPEEIHQEKGNL